MHLHLFYLSTAGLEKSLGGKAFEDILNTDELVNEYDLAAALTEQPAKQHRSKSSRGSGNGGRQRSATPEKQSAADLLRDSGMSARERNKLKRKFKALQRQDSMRAGCTDTKSRVSNSSSSNQASYCI